MQEYELKICFADNLLALEKKSQSMKGILSSLEGVIQNTDSLFGEICEPQLMQRYHKEMSRCRKLFQSQLSGLSGVFSRLLINLKKNSAIEQIFAQSEDETESANPNDHYKQFEEDNTRLTFEGGSPENPPMELREPCRRSKRIAKRLSRPVLDN